MNYFPIQQQVQQQRADSEQRQADAERQARLNAVPQLLEMGMSQEQVAQVLSLRLAEVETGKNEVGE
ncbi:hypothetical protein [Anabaena sp. CCY 9910]|uniref:hypothetical protein n=1 Tax=Anabaena sp. CCY 9910 TaxID=3103870 RepID=UPI0039DF2E62